MSELNGAARRTDLIEHGTQKGLATGKIAVAAFSWAKTGWEIYRIAKFGAVFTGPWGWAAVLAVELVVEFAISPAIEQGVQYLVAKKHGGEPGIETGSPNVFVNKLEAARGGGKDTVICPKGKKVMQGSKWVSINLKPAARLEDITECPGNISSASKNVAIGGPPTHYNPHLKLEIVLLVFGAYNSGKKGMVEAIMDGVKNGVPATAGQVLKAGGKEFASDLYKGGKDLWEQEGSPWPW